MPSNRSSSFSFIVVATVVAGLVTSIVVSSQNTEVRKRASEPRTGVMTYAQTLAPGFPEFPVPVDAVVETSLRKEQGTQIGFSATWITSLTLIDLQNFYTQSLSENGWVITFPFDDSSDSQEKFLQAQKGKSELYLELEKEGTENKITVDFPFR